MDEFLPHGGHDPYENAGLSMEINWVIPVSFIAIAALLIACLSITGYISFQGGSIPQSAIIDDEGTATSSTGVLLSSALSADIPDFATALLVANKFASKLTRRATNPDDSVVKEFLGSEGFFLPVRTDTTATLFNQTQNNDMILFVNGSPTFIDATDDDPSQLIFTLAEHNGATTKNCAFVFTREIALGDKNIVFQFAGGNPGNVLNEFKLGKSVAYSTSVGGQGQDHKAVPADNTKKILTLDGATGTKILPGSYIYLRSYDGDLSLSFVGMFLIGGADANTLEFS